MGSACLQCAGIRNQTRRKARKRFRYPLYEGYQCAHGPVKEYGGKRSFPPATPLPRNHTNLSAKRTRSDKPVDKEQAPPPSRELNVKK